MTTQTTDFWTTVAAIGWETKTTDVDAIKVELMRHGPEACMALRAEYNAAIRTLSQAAAKAGHDYCCDSWSDTLSQVIGLGREEFDRNVADPGRLLERMNAGDYTESFSYCLPWPDDFNMYSFADLRRRGDEVVEACTAVTSRWADAAQLGFATCDDIARVRELMSGPVKSWVDCETELVELANRIARNPAHSALGQLRNPWLVRNTVSDAKFALVLHG